MRERGKRWKEREWENPVDSKLSLSNPKAWFISTNLSLKVSDYYF